MYICTSQKERILISHYIKANFFKSCKKWFENCPPKTTNESPDLSGLFYLQEVTSSLEAQIGSKKANFDAGEEVGLFLVLPEPPLSLGNPFHSLIYSFLSGLIGLGITDPNDVFLTERI